MLNPRRILNQEEGDTGREGWPSPVLKTRARPERRRGALGERPGRLQRQQHAGSQHHLGGHRPNGPHHHRCVAVPDRHAANDFSADGQAFEKGYQLWAKDVNAHGGLLGRPVKLIILNDDSSPNQVVTNYQTLLGADHVDLTFGPFSSLLTAPASSVAARYGMAFVEGAGRRAVRLRHTLQPG